MSDGEKLTFIIMYIILFPIVSAIIKLIFEDKEDK